LNFELGEEEVGVWARVNTQKPLFAVMIPIIVLAWVSLLIWGLSPYARFISHESLEGIHLEHSSSVVAIQVAGWTLMLVAMMLPTTLPLVSLFYGIAARRPNRARLVALLLTGYLSIWAAFGVMVHWGDFALHTIADQFTWLHNHELIAAATLLLAGLYQFSPLKYKCLDKCRSPLSFIMEHWQGRRDQMQSFLLGVHHGLFCIGCCWALMLLMFGVGAGSFSWMLVLGGVMAVEKNAPWGRRLSAPLGLFLLGLGLSIALTAVV
jgi:predicted metal-binding membrane protein